MKLSKKKERSTTRPARRVLVKTLLLDASLPYWRQIAKIFLSVEYSLSREPHGHVSRIVERKLFYGKDLYLFPI